MITTAPPSEVTKVAACAWEVPVGTVVSRGGRPDLAGDLLDTVTAPTLLIVGGADDVVLELNRAAATRLCCENVLEVIPGATHLFEEPGPLARVASLPASWFTTHLGVAPKRAVPA